MTDYYVLILFYLALGAFVGFMAGLLGIGGGLIIVPVLIYVFLQFLDVAPSVVMPMAIATSLATIILTGFSSALTHYKLGNVNVGLVIWSGIGIAFGALIGPQIAAIMSADKLKTVFAILVFLIALQMIFIRPKKSDTSISKPILVLIGTITGAISAFMGIGGGAILVPALVWFKIDIKRAIGCAACCGLIIAIFGTISFIHAGWGVQGLPKGSVGYLYLPAAIGIVVISIFTARIGAKLSHRLDTKKLKQIFAGFLILVSLRMLLG